MSTVTVYVVLADASDEHKDQRLGMFFQVLDADRFLAGLRGWRNPRVIAEVMNASDVHPAHAAVPSVVKALASAPTKTS
jgi:hypothetical protein